MKKRFFLFAILAAFLLIPMSSMALNWDATYWNALIKGNLRVGTGSTPNITQNGDDVFIEGQLEVDGVPRFDATTMIIRGVTYTLPSADGAASAYLQTNGSGALSWASGTSGSLDDGYNSGATITVDAGALQLNGSHASNDTFFVNKTAGTGDAIQITNAGDGYDINGTAGTWYITKAGVATFASFSPLTAGLSISGGVVNLNASSNNATNVNTGTSSGAVTIGGGTGTVAVNSSVWDIATTGAASGFTTISMTDDLSLANGKAVKGSTTTAETIAIQTYDNDNTTYRSSILLTNGDTPAVLIGTNNETVAINSADWDISTTGVMTGIGAITMDGLLTGSLGATITGAVVNLNAASNFAVNIATGNSTGTVTIGGTANQQIDIGNGAAVKAVALGSSNTTSTTTLLSGSGG
ncbi:MAG: hypothetical protein WCY09_09310, partial [Candidatus Omnitrophota bacterium]